MDPLGELGAELSGRQTTATSAALQEPPVTQPPALLCSPVKFCLPAADPLPLPPHLQHLQLQQQLYSYALQQLHGLRPPAPALVAPPWPVAYPYKLLDPRLAALCRPPEEPKPQHSYIGLIAMAILSHADKKLVLSDIYQYILDNYSYFRNRGTGWRNSIRHNLSLNDCFVKAGRSPNGKGHYWAIHPANIEDFKKGDFRRRKAQRRVRKHMGLTVDDEDSMSPPPPPTPSWAGLPPAAPPRRRQFDVASLLAPDVPGEPASPPRATPHSCEVELDVVGGDEELPDQLSPLAVQHPRPAVPPLPPSPPTPGGGHGCP